MKKFFKITGIVILVIILLMILLPFLFKGKIIEIVKKQANKNLNATLNFEDAGLNFFSSFPDLTLTLDELSIVNKAPFEGDTLVRLKEFSASVDLWSIIGGDQIKVEGISLDEPSIFVYVLKDSTANYNITKEEPKAEADTAKGGNLAVRLKKYSINNGTVAYIDQTSDMALMIRNLNHSGSGDFSKENFMLETNTEIGELTFEKSGIKYLNKAKAKAEINLNADMKEKKFTFDKNEFQLNNLKLKFDGFVQKLEEGMKMDVTFASVNNDFKDIISLIPAVYSQNFEDIKSSGKMSLKGSAKGEYKGENLPAFDVAVNVNNGKFQYPKLPTPVNNVNMDLSINNPGGNADKTIINMKSLHLELGNEPFDASLLVKTPKSSPYIDAKAKGKIDLGKLKNALYMEGVTKLEGIINSDFSASGTIAGSDVKSIENISAQGNISVSNIVYGTSKLPDEVRISRGSLVLTPKRFNLNDLNIQIGKSDLKAQGDLENMVSYVLSDGTIKGNLSLSSNYFDVNPLMSGDEETTSKSKDTSKVKATSLPERVNFTLNSNFKKIIYDNLTLTDVKGTIIIADQKAVLKNLSMNTLGGNIVADGFYHAPEGENPDIAFSLVINDLGFKDAFKTFVSVQRFAPMAQYIEGKFNSKLNMTSTLDENMQPVWNSFNSKGSFNIKNAAIKDFKPLQAVGNALNLDVLKNPALNNVSTTFTITNGRLYVDPFSFKVLNYDVAVSGSNGIDQTIDYSLGVKIPASNLKQQGNKAISSILKKDVQLITANSVEVKANIKGSINDPSVSTSAGDIVQETKKEVTQQVKQEVNKQIEEKKQEAQKEVQKEVQKQTDTVKTKLQKEVTKKLKNLFKK
ncbi:MAG TPA: AsmA-like C-terminal region-containing protein [Ignavibacteriaceae bacterium]|nr:AsmA-like C-terminal region-containing protein [Ignavibacteriaceae bacterium]